MEIKSTYFSSTCLLSSNSVDDHDQDDWETAGARGHMIKKKHKKTNISLMQENSNHLKPVQPRSLSHSSVNADLELFQLCFQTELNLQRFIQNHALS